MKKVIKVSESRLIDIIENIILKESGEVKNYMFFQNLKTIKESIDHLWM